MQASFQRAIRRSFGSCRLLASTAVATAILAAPRMALACAVCFSGRDDETQLAFRIATGGMTLMPFLLVGGLLLWLRKRFREIADEEDRLSAGAAVRRAAPVDRAQSR
jgi:hypothetical protein